MNTPGSHTNLDSYTGVLMIALRKSLFFLLALIAGSVLVSAQETQEGRLMRFLDIYKDKVTFFYGGDLWLASTSGGVALRIISGLGPEPFSKFCQVGDGIVFTVVISC